MKRRTFFLGTFSSLLAPTFAHASSVGGFVAVTGDRFSVDGKNYRLADIIAPSIYSLHEHEEPYADKAMNALRRIVARRQLVMNAVAPMTRWGEESVEARLAGEGKTLQEQLVYAGAARVAPEAENIALIDQLFEAERAARKARRGLWDLRAYRIFKADDAKGAIGAFHIIEGVVKSAAKTRSRFYLNFGEDYRTDFTAGLRSRLYNKWLRAGFDMAALEKKHVRIRGFVDNINGPSIDVTHVKQVEILNEKTGADDDAGFLGAVSGVN